jgi:hypothetical protein
MRRAKGPASASIGFGGPPRKFKSNIKGHKLSLILKSASSQNRYFAPPSNADLMKKDRMSPPYEI